MCLMLPSLEAKNGRLRREWVLIYSLYISSKEANHSQCDLMSYPYKDFWCFLRMMSGIVLSVYSPFLTCFINIMFQMPLKKLTPSWGHISALSQDILNSYSSIVIRVINCHHCCSDGRLQTEQICKGVFSTVFMSLRRRGCFVR